MDLIEDGKLLHISPEASGFDSPVKIDTSRFQTDTDIFAALLRLDGDAGESAGGDTARRDEVLYYSPESSLLHGLPFPGYHRLSTAAFSCAMVLSGEERGQAAFSRMYPLRLRPKV